MRLQRPTNLCIAVVFGAAATAACSPKQYRVVASFSRVDCDVGRDVETLHFRNCGMFLGWLCRDSERRVWGTFGHLRYDNPTRTFPECDNLLTEQCGDAAESHFEAREAVARAAREVSGRWLLLLLLL